MSMTGTTTGTNRWTMPTVIGGLLWMIVAFAGAGMFFWDGIEVLLKAWQLAEYSHGPLIPLLSGFMFLRQLSQHLITDPVAMLIVNPFEIINIDKGNDERNTLSNGQCALLLKRFKQVAAVIQPRQLVRYGEFFDSR